MADPMYSTDEAAEREMPEAGDIRHDQTPEHRVPRPGNAPAPGQRPSESGSTPSDIETDPVEDTQALSAAEVAALTGETEEEDETGAPERVAEAEDEHPLESPEAIRHPRGGGGND